MLSYLLFLLLALTGAILQFFTLRYELRMFQQNSYRVERFLRWYLGGRNFFGATLSFFKREIVKLPLVYTARVKRLIVSDLLLTYLLCGLLLYMISWVEGYDFVSVFTRPWAALLAFAPLLLLSKGLLLLANLVNTPVEKAIVRWYYKDAKKKIDSHKGLIIIGVTGSYGKTSTKNYLYRILSEKYNTLVTPGNFNTTLGVVRTIREKLEPYHQVFIVEMGAKQVGDIQEICDLVHPHISIVSSVGPMHLETFGSFANIQKTKFELVRSLPCDGLAVINADSQGIASYQEVPTHCKVIRYGVKNGEYKAENLQYSTEGSSFDLEGVSYKTNLLGESNILNILASCAVARHLGLSERQIQMAVAKLQQVEHRLFVSRQGTVTVIDDAYNSNPEGASMALDVLRDIKGGRKILVTPGFVELGERQYEECYNLGKKAAQCADFLVIVNKYNRQAIQKGALEGGLNEENILCVDSLNQAVAALRYLFAPGDVVLYENDLPDTFK